MGLNPIMLHDIMGFLFRSRNHTNTENKHPIFHALRLPRRGLKPRCGGCGGVVVIRAGLDQTPLPPQIVS